MRLTAVRLRNWKAFPVLNLDLQPSAPDRTIAIIEGSNGFGKTSLLEGMILCLYGREGLPLVGRAAGGGRPELSYDGFLERALHRDARGEEANASVELTYEGLAARLTIQRIWYFTAAGRHRRSDEELRLWEGLDEELVPLPEGEERIAHAREIVARMLLPSRLGPFFFFDGEHLDRLARVDLDAQVRVGLEHALGVPLLHILSDDLRVYARDRRRQLKSIVGPELDELTMVVGELDRQERATLASLDEMGQELTPLRGERDATVAQIGSLHGDSYANFKRLFEEREQLGRTRDVLQERLRQTLSFDLALALAGPDLRRSTREQLAHDARAERHAATIALSSARYASLIERFSKPVELAAAGLSGDQWPLLEARLKAHWDDVWAEDAGSATVARRHQHLGESDRLMVDDRLRLLETLAVDTIANLARETANADLAVSDVDRRIAEQRGADATSQNLADRLRDTQNRIGMLEERSRELGRTLDALRGELAARRRALAKLRADADISAPALARADRAEGVARTVDALVARLFPLNLEAFSAAVTAAYRAMAHKEDVQEIRIAANGTVSLIDLRGRDLRDLDASAGESQIFAFALMAAITSLAAPFPIVLDTPLARLDPAHRDRVLRYFASLDRQVIFLSQPTELSGRYLEPLQSKLGCQLQLSHEAGRSGSERPVSPAMQEALL